MANLSWGIDDPSVVTEFEIHGSDQEGFTPSSSTLEATLPSTEREFTTTSNFDYYLIVVKRSSGNDLVSQPVSSIRAESGDTPVLSSQEEDVGITLNASGDLSPHVSSDWVIIEDGETVGLSKNYLIYLEDESNLTSLNLAYYTGDDSSDSDELYPGSYEARVRFNGSGGMTTGWSDGYEFDVIALVDQPSILSASFGNYSVSATSTVFSSSDLSDSHDSSLWELYAGDYLINTLDSASSLSSAELNATGEKWTFSGHTSGVRSISLIPDGRLVSASFSNEAIRISSSGTNPRSYSSSLSVHDAVADNTMIHLATSNGILKRRMLNDGIMWSRSRDGATVYAITLDEESNVYAGWFDNTLTKMDPDGNTLWEFSGHTSPVSAVALGADGFIYSGSWDNTVRKISPSGSQVWVYSGHSSRVAGVAVDSEGYVYSASFDNTVRKLDPNGNEVWIFDGHSDSVNDITVGSTGLIHTASTDNTSKTLTPDGEEIYEFVGHSGLVSGVVENQGVIYTSSGDGTVRSHVVLTGLPLRVRVRHRGSSGNTSMFSSLFEVNT